METNLEVTTLTDCVEHSIYKYVEDNALGPGDRLPSEEELAQQLEVGRNVVREALSRLRSAGMISSRKKRGIVLTAVNPARGLAKCLIPQMMDRSSIVDLLQMRILLEQSIIPLLFDRLKTEDLDELEEILHDDNGGEGGLSSMENELRFHCRIFQITGNETLAGFQEALIPVYRYVHDHISDFQEYCTGRKVSHRELLDALKSGVQDCYSKAVAGHLEAYSRFVEHHRKVKAEDR